jgi:cold shock CspA family protein
VNGVVVAFDAAAGLGSVAGSDGATYLFHCVEIADGSRAIDVGTEVSFRSLAKLGAVEAGCLRPR